MSLALQFKNNTKEPKADELLIVGLLCALDNYHYYYFEKGVISFFLAFQRSKNQLIWRGLFIANATHDLTESIGKFSFQLLLLD